MNLDFVLEAIRGAFSPEQMSIFMNSTAEDAVGDNFLILFHEKFHSWQFYLTPYGHLKWGCYRTSSSDVVDIWMHGTRNHNDDRRLPISFLFKKDDEESLFAVAQIYLQEFALYNMNLMERNIINEEIESMLPSPKEDYFPIVEVHGETYEINGIDIIECFAKYQEALLAGISEEKLFEDVMEPNILRKEYYMAYLYYIQELKGERILEFPVVCELSLMVNKLCKFTDLVEWKVLHPAWRFVNIIKCLKDNPEIVELSIENFKVDFDKYCNNVLELCGYESTNTIWDSAIEYAKSTDLKMATKMTRAIDFKRKYPWALAYPFYSLDDEYAELLHTFHPFFYRFNDTSIYSAYDNDTQNEVVFENNFQAFVHQIKGNMSSFSIYKDEIQCGYSYFGLKGCKYLEDNLCCGSINRYSENLEIELDESLNLVSGCEFELFLNAIGTSIKEISIGDISKKINFKEIASKAKNR